MRDEVSYQSWQVRFSTFIQKLIETDSEIFIDRIEDAANGQERNRTGRGCRRDSGALHVQGYGPRLCRQVAFLLRRQHDTIDGENRSETVPTVPSPNHGYGRIQ